MFPCYILLLALPLVASNSFYWGSCPTPAVQANFSMEQFLGQWYVIQKLVPIYEFEMGRCSQGDLVRRDDNSVSITFSQIVNYNVQTMHGVLYQGMEEPAKMEFSYKTNNDFLNTMLPRCQWWVLKTDYSSMSVIYTCKEFFGIFYVENAAIISRDRSLPREVVIDARDLLYEECVDIRHMTVVDQFNCN